MTAILESQLLQYKLSYEIVYDRAEEVLRGYQSIKDTYYSVEFARIEGDTIVYEGTERYNGYGDERSVSVELPVRALTDDSYLTELREEHEAEVKTKERRKKRKAAEQKRAQKKREEAELARLKEKYG